MVVDGCGLGMGTHSKEILGSSGYVLGEEGEVIAFVGTWFISHLSLSKRRGQRSEGTASIS